MNNSIDFETTGRLVMLDLWGCDFDTLNDPTYLARHAKTAAEKAGMHVLAISMVPFHPQGVSIALVLSESHLTIHTSPEQGYAAIDIFTCGHGKPQVAANHLLAVLKPGQIFTKGIERGIKSPAGAEERNGTLQPGTVHHA
ncbi:MAG: S-adenosylmethionine decarboxylase proenzyme precursor [Syntrophorhabdus sp. PtaU1.Bin002]|nr:MAG: S-adenosylmethionine decarboxylase proenzyme precursor [Syntrophorhabdus sp. PtaU1.Bin002]